MKHFFWYLLIGLSVGQASWAESVTPRLPEEMVMVAPQLTAVRRGLEIQRLVHGQFKQDGDQVTVVLHLIRHPMNQTPTCQSGDHDCLPNVSDSMTLRLNHPEMSRLEQYQTLLHPRDDSTYLKFPIFREMFELLVVDGLNIQPQGDAWTMTRDDGVATIWQPMSLEQASNTSYFVRNFALLSTSEVEQCIASQLARVYAIEAPSAEQQALLDAVSLNAEKHRLRDREETNRYKQAMMMEFSAKYLSGMDNWPQSADEFVSMEKFKEIIDPIDAHALFMENFERISSAAHYYRRLDLFSNEYTPDEQVRIVCSDLVNLNSP